MLTPPCRWVWYSILDCRPLTELKPPTWIPSTSTTKRKVRKGSWAGPVGAMVGSIVQVDAGFMIVGAHRLVDSADLLAPPSPVTMLNSKNII
ncbi:hypothetical protein amb1887 [Paramagnetospirillum magneticum AMB-1]|uniref:Uncharacterized protein n=1 Tax=Paramagnetospirillum magneticum (strain ATCC 700264 / AMB-1) TaxID=342108 RepID=Q2W634_PARM1|nr:hypothetical protein amb1887 [Paramagnetospirillum magneticum AMB-1]